MKKFTKIHTGNPVPWVRRSACLFTGFTLGLRKVRIRKSSDVLVSIVNFFIQMSICRGQSSNARRICIPGLNAAYSRKISSVVFCRSTHPGRVSLISLRAGRYFLYLECCLIFFSPFFILGRQQILLLKVNSLSLGR
jgi:hypothetical protein